MKTMNVTQVLNSHWEPTPGGKVDKNGNNYYVYQVDRVTDSTTPEIREILRKEELDLFCESDDWKVTIS